MEAGKRQEPGADLGRRPDDDQPRRGTGLCLSGGGYRAALFHLGALRRLNEIGALGLLRTVSGASGGAIPTSLLTDPRLGWPEAGEPGRVRGFEDYVAAPIRALTAVNVRTPALLRRLLPWRWCDRDTAVRSLAQRLAHEVPHFATPLRDLRPSGPVSVIVATDVTYGVDWRFEDAGRCAPSGRIGDYWQGYGNPPGSLRLAEAIAASCAFPPVFAPLQLPSTDLQLRGGAGRPEQTVYLTDGGVYDNLALEPVWRDHRTVLASDGGSVFRARSAGSVLGLMLRILGIASSGGSAIRLRWLHASMAGGLVDGATWALDDVTATGYPADVVQLIEDIRTDLDAFSLVEQHVLERVGYLVAAAAITAYARELILLDIPVQAPHAEVADPDVVRQGLADSARMRWSGRW